MKDDILTPEDFGLLFGVVCKLEKEGKGSDENTTNAQVRLLVSYTALHRNYTNLIKAMAYSSTSDEVH